MTSNWAGKGRRPIGALQKTSIRSGSLVSIRAGLSMRGRAGAALGVVGAGFVGEVAAGRTLEWTEV
jgi:hypothetical protein